MKFRIVRSLICVCALALPIFAQSPGAPAHESTIDGRWEGKVMTQGAEQVIQFEFKNSNGEVSGLVTLGEGQPLEVKNGRLDGAKLTLSTMQNTSGDGDPIMMSWIGTVDVEGESMRFNRTTGNGDSQRDFLELEAKRVSILGRQGKGSR